MTVFGISPVTTPRTEESDAVERKELHHLARALYHVENGDWGYDPGNPEHLDWYRYARALHDAVRRSRGEAV